MVKLGYNCNDFMNQIESSQEILLAVGWLISTQDVLEIFISQLNRPIDDEYFKEKHFQVKIIIVYTNFSSAYSFSHANDNSSTYEDYFKIFLKKEFFM